MAGGYSGEAAGAKIGNRGELRWRRLGRRAILTQTVGAAPKGVRFARLAAKPNLTSLFFGTERSRLAKDLPSLRKKMRDDAMLWVSWPKKSAGVPTTVRTEDVVRECALPRTVDTKVCAVDETWAGFSFGGAAREPEVDSATAPVA